MMETPTLPPLPRLPTTRELTRERLAQLHEVTFTLTPWTPTPTCWGPLLHLWHQIPTTDEQVLAFGPIALEPEAFLRSHTAGLECLLITHTGTDWRKGEGLLGFALLDDIIELVSARIHVYVYPSWRHPTLTRKFASVVLAHLFGTRGFLTVYTRIPVSLRPVMQFAYRCGFASVGITHQTCLHAGVPVDGVIMELTVERWQTLDPLVRRE